MREKNTIPLNNLYVHVYHCSIVFVTYSVDTKRLELAILVHNSAILNAMTIKII